MKADLLIRILSRMGATIITNRGKGGHVMVRFNDKQTVVPTGSGDLRTGALKGILKQLDLTLEDLAGK